MLVAQRAHAFGMRLVAYDPFVSADRARQLGVQLADTMDDLVAISDFVTIHATKTPDTIGLVNAEVLAHAKPGMRLINAGRGGIVDEDALADAIRDGRLGGAAIDTFAAGAHHRVAVVRARQRGRHAAPRRVHRGGAGQGGRDDRRAGRARAARRLRSVRGQRRRVGGVGDRAAVPAAWPSASAGCSPVSPAARPTRSKCSTKARSPTTTAACSRCRSSRACSARSSTSRSSFVNAPQLAEERGIAVRETKSADARDYVNLIEVRGTIGERDRAGRGHVVRQAAEARASSASTSTPSTCRPRGYMLVVHNDDTPGMIGASRPCSATRSVNISDMDVGRSPSGEAALMVLATDSPVPPETIAQVLAVPGVQSARAIDLG